MRGSDSKWGPAIAAASDAGRIRERNEDCVGTPRQMGIPDRLLLTRGTLLAVADGMGGHAAGEVASRHAVQVLYGEYYADPSPSLPDSLRRAIEQANAEVYALGSGSIGTMGMGTTLVAAMLVRDQLIVANVGDSRAYLVHRGRARQVTRDHSWVAESLQAGLIDEQQAREHTYRHVITRSLGEKPTVEVDLFQERLLPGDAVVLCSDGLTNEVDDASIAQVAGQRSPADAAATLVSLANDRGGHDNVSVVLARVPAAGKGTVAPLLAAASAAAVVLILAIGLLAGSRWQGFGRFQPSPTVLATADPTASPATGTRTPLPSWTTPTPAVSSPPASTAGQAASPQPAGPGKGTGPQATAADLFSSPLGGSSPVPPTATTPPTRSVPTGPVRLPVEWICQGPKCSTPQVQWNLLQILGYHPRHHLERGHGRYGDIEDLLELDGADLIARPAHVLTCAFGQVQEPAADGPDDCFALDRGGLICGSDVPETGSTLMVLGPVDDNVLKAEAVLYWEGEAQEPVQAQKEVKSPHIWFLGGGCEALPYFEDYDLDGQPFLVYSFWGGKEMPRIPGKIEQSSPAIFVWDEQQHSYVPWERREGNP